MSEILQVEGCRMYHMSPHHKPRVLLDDDRWADSCLPGEEVGYFCSLYKSYLHVIFMYVWVDCSFSMVAKISIINYLIRMSNSCKCMGQWGSLTEGLEARLCTCTFMWKVFCMHAAIASFPGSPSPNTNMCTHAGRAWYLFPCEHDMIKIAPQCLKQKTAFCVLFNQLRVQSSVCMIFNS